MSGAIEQMISQEHLWIVVREHDDSGQGNTTGRLPLELDGTSERAPDGLTLEAERVEKLFQAPAPNMDDLKGETERDGVPEQKIDSAEGSGELVTWVSTTSQGYFEQCWFKFGGVEKCKTRSEMGMSKQDAWKNRDFIILGGSAVAEFVTDAFLGPYEELVAENDVVNGLYSDFGPMFRQTPYTMVEISVQQKMAETMYQNLGTAPSEMSNDALLMLSLVHDIVTDAVSLAECPDSEFDLESYLKDQKKDAEQLNNFRRP